VLTGSDPRDQHVRLDRFTLIAVCERKVVHPRPRAWPAQLRPPYASPVLAYVFWHRPRAAVAAGEYEARLLAFHEALAAHPPEGLRGSHVARLAAAPWLPGDGPVYEDWYLVTDWAALGRLNDAAVQGPRRPPHDAAAEAAADGSAGIYRRTLGAPRPDGALASWFAKPDGLTYSALGETLDERLAGRDASMWQRQMTLGPAPEFCLLADEAVELAPWAVTTVAREALR